MKNFVNEAATITFPAPGAITSGQVNSFGDCLGVAQADAETGEPVVHVVEGAFIVPKATGQAWTVGELVNWDSSQGEFTTGATGSPGDVTAGAVIWASAASGDTTGIVKLVPGKGTGS